MTAGTTRESRWASVPMSLALAVALGLLGSTWRSITSDDRALILAGACAAAVLAAGALLRAIRVPGALVPVIQLVVLAAAVAATSGAVGRPGSVTALIGQGLDHFVSSTAPMPTDAGATLLLCLSIGAIALAADWLTITVKQPALVVVPLLALLLVPALAPKTHQLPAWGMVFFAGGLALVLLVAAPDRIGGRRGAALWSAGALVTALALVLAVAVAPRIPVPAPTRGADGTPLSMADLSLSLKRELTQGADTPALEYRSTGDEGVYLRLYSLPTFNADGWKLTSSNVRTGALTRPPGLRDGVPRTTDVTITGLQTEWLPAPYAPVSTTAGEDWGFLPDSLSILALGVEDREIATIGLSYTVESLDAQPTDDAIEAITASALPPDADVTASVPSDISPKLVRLTHQITDQATTPGAKALAILDYLEQPQFRYSLDAAPGSGYAALEDFLLVDRAGFCVQYAASMAIMARIAGIPSRMAIGFTPGTPEGDHWTVTMHDLHSWPELYLDGWGWVAFEPTPGRGDSVPAAIPEPTPTPDEPTQAPAPPVDPEPDPDEPAVESPTAEPAAGSDSPGPRWPWLLAGVSLLVLAAPAALRARRRRLRLRAGADPRHAALDAWDEIRDLTLDHRRPWPAASPRYAAADLILGLGQEAVADDIQALALAAERAQFAGPDTAVAPQDWTPVVVGYASLLTDRASLSGRFWARLLPASLFR